MIHYFWYAAGLLTGIAAAFLLTALVRATASNDANRKRRYVLAAATLLTLTIPALLLYQFLGRPDALEGTRALAAHPAFGGGAAATPGESLEVATGKLEQRIAEQGGNRDDWLLLAQSYEFLGRAQDAERARAGAQAAAPRIDSAPQQAASAQWASAAPAALTQYRARVQADRRDAEAWLGLATLQRQQRDFAAARAAYAELIGLQAMSADAWADYADVLASLADGSLSGESARAIDSALAIDNRHVKALWLKASLAHQEHRYPEALSLWRELRGLIPVGSPDARIIDANVTEAEALAGSAASSNQGRAGEKALMVSGTVAIDREFAGRVPPGATLFIYAKAVDSPGPPVAVLRTAASSWPVSFRLDDTLAMIPERKLSSFERVVVEARISRSGNATPASGDLLATSPVVRPADGKELRLIISREIG